MKLLRTQTADLQLCEYFGADLFRIKYAILSHTWEDGEILFADIGVDGLDAKKGYRKVNSARELARLHGYDFIWIDTCCIDKSSSAELSEAINSMYSWYQNAAVCYAYLCDVHEVVPLNAGYTSHFARSRWFTRGWTLQELIAPKTLKFYSSDWKQIGTKNHLHKVIATITRIDSSILTGHASIERTSVARRMSWAAYRVTSRTEDMAYCLMGMFAVSMPLLYGEGKRAFLRLQEELMKHTDDQSLFAWGLHKDAFTGMLAESPSDFAQTGSVVPYQGGQSSTSFSFTNKGINIDVGMSRLLGNIYTATLNCVDLSDAALGDFVTLHLQQNANDDRQYARCAPPRDYISTYNYTDSRGELKNVYVSQKEPQTPNHCVIFLRRGPKPTKHQNLELRSMFSSIPTWREVENVPFIPFVDAFIQRHQKISRDWISDNNPNRLDLGLLSHNPHFSNLSNANSHWILRFEGLSLASKIELYVKIHYYLGKLIVTAGMRQMTLSSEHANDHGRECLWTNDLEVKSLVMIRKLDLPTCDFYILDFDMHSDVAAWSTVPGRRLLDSSMYSRSSVRTFWAPGDDVACLSLTKSKIEKAPTHAIYELAAVAEPHGITEAQQYLIDERDYVTRLVNGRQMQLEDDRLEVEYCR